ncbi:hypothetical protein C7M84_005932, partial [Penaeus vannamei]
MRACILIQPFEEIDEKFEEFSETIDIVVLPGLLSERPQLVDDAVLDPHPFGLIQAFEEIAEEVLDERPQLVDDAVLDPHPFGLIQAFEEIAEEVLESVESFVKVLVVTSWSPSRALGRWISFSFGGVLGGFLSIFEKEVEDFEFNHLGLIQPFEKVVEKFEEFMITIAVLLSERPQLVDDAVLDPHPFGLIQAFEEIAEEVLESVESFVKVLKVVEKFEEFMITIAVLLSERPQLVDDAVLDPHPFGLIQAFEEIAEEVLESVESFVKVLEVEDFEFNHLGLIQPFEKVVEKFEEFMITIAVLLSERPQLVDDAVLDPHPFGLIQAFEEIAEEVLESVESFVKVLEVVEKFEEFMITIAVLLSERPQLVDDAVLDPHPFGLIQAFEEIAEEVLESVESFVKVLKVVEKFEEFMITIAVLLSERPQLVDDAVLDPHPFGLIQAFEEIAEEVLESVESFVKVLKVVEKFEEFMITIAVLLSERPQLVDDAVLDPHPFGLIQAFEEIAEEVLESVESFVKVLKVVEKFEEFMITIAVLLSERPQLVDDAVLDPHPFGLIQAFEEIAEEVLESVESFVKVLKVVEKFEEFMITIAVLLSERPQLVDDAVLDPHPFGLIQAFEEIAEEVLESVESFVKVLKVVEKFEEFMITIAVLLSERPQLVDDAVLDPHPFGLIQAFEEIAEEVLESVESFVKVLKVVEKFEEFMITIAVLLSERPQLVDDAVLDPHPFGLIQAFEEIAEEVLESVESFVKVLEVEDFEFNHLGLIQPFEKVVEKFEEFMSERPQLVDDAVLDPHPFGLIQAFEEIAEEVLESVESFVKVLKVVEKFEEFMITLAVLLSERPQLVDDAVLDPHPFGLIQAFEEIAEEVLESVESFVKVLEVEDFDFNPFGLIQPFEEIEEKFEEFSETIDIVVLPGLLSERPQLVDDAVLDPHPFGLIQAFEEIAEEVLESVESFVKVLDEKSEEFIVTRAAVLSEGQLVDDAVLDPHPFGLIQAFEEIAEEVLESVESFVKVLKVVEKFEEFMITIAVLLSERPQLVDDAVLDPHPFGLIQAFEEIAEEVLESVESFVKVLEVEDFDFNPFGLIQPFEEIEEKFEEFSETIDIVVLPGLLSERPQLVDDAVLDPHPFGLIQAFEEIAEEVLESVESFVKVLEVEDFDFNPFGLIQPFEEIEEKFEEFSETIDIVVSPAFLASALNWSMMPFWILILSASSKPLRRSLRKSWSRSSLSSKSLAAVLSEGQLVDDAVLDPHPFGLIQAFEEIAEEVLESVESFVKVLKVVEKFEEFMITLAVLLSERPQLVDDAVLDPHPFGLIQAFEEIAEEVLESVESFVKVLEVEDFDFNPFGLIQPFEEIEEKFEEFSETIDIVVLPGLLSERPQLVDDAVLDPHPFGLIQAFEEIAEEVLEMRNLRKFIVTRAAVLSEGQLVDDAVLDPHPFGLIQAFEEIAEEVLESVESFVKVLKVVEKFEEFMITLAVLLSERPQLVDDAVLDPHPFGLIQAFEEIAEEVLESVESFVKVLEVEDFDFNPFGLIQPFEEIEEKFEEFSETIDIVVLPAFLASALNWSMMPFWILILSASSKPLRRSLRKSWSRSSLSSKSFERPQLVDDAVLDPHPFGLIQAFEEIAEEVLESVESFVKVLEVEDFDFNPFGLIQPFEEIEEKFEEFSETIDIVVLPGLLSERPQLVDDAVLDPHPFGLIQAFEEIAEEVLESVESFVKVLDEKSEEFIVTRAAVLSEGQLVDDAVLDPHPFGLIQAFEEIAEEVLDERPQLVDDAVLDPHPFGLIQAFEEIAEEVLESVESFVKEVEDFDFNPFGLIQPFEEIEEKFEEFSETIDIVVLPGLLSERPQLVDDAVLDPHPFGLIQAFEEIAEEVLESVESFVKVLEVEDFDFNPFGLIQPFEEIEEKFEEFSETIDIVVLPGLLSERPQLVDDAVLDPHPFGLIQAFEEMAEEVLESVEPFVKVL